VAAGADSSPTVISDTSPLARLRIATLPDGFKAQKEKPTFQGSWC